MAPRVGRRAWATATASSARPASGRCPTARRDGRSCRRPSGRGPTASGCPRTGLPSARCSPRRRRPGRARRSRRRIRPARCPASRARHTSRSAWGVSPRPSSAPGPSSARRRPLRRRRAAPSSESKRGMLRGWPRFEFASSSFALPAAYAPGRRSTLRTPGRPASGSARVARESGYSAESRCVTSTRAAPQELERRLEPAAARADDRHLVDDERRRVESRRRVMRRLPDDGAARPDELDRARASRRASRSPRRRDRRKPAAPGSRRPRRATSAPASSSTAAASEPSLPTPSTAACVLSVTST